MFIDSDGEFELKKDKFLVILLSKGDFHSKIILERDVTKLQKIWHESDLTGSHFPWTASVAISSGTCFRILSCFFSGKSTLMIHEVS